jgi:hypothetical protein
MNAVNSTSQLCVACGYDLTGRALGETCPECGGTVVENPFRGAWRDGCVRGRFIVGAWIVVAAYAIGVLAVAWISIVRRLGAPSVQAETLQLVVDACLFVSLFWLVRAAWRIGSVRVFVCLIVLLLVGRGFWTVPRLWGGFPPSAGLSSVLAAGVWGVNALLCCMPPLLARSAGQPTRRRWLVACAVVGAVPCVAYVLAFCGFFNEGRAETVFAMWLKYGGRMVGPIADLAGMLLLVRGMTRATQSCFVAR